MITTRNDGPLRYTTIQKTNKTSWLRHDDGHAEIAFTSHSETKYLSVFLRETSSKGTGKEAMVTLEGAEVVALYEHLRDLLAP